MFNETKQLQLTDATSLNRNGDKYTWFGGIVLNGNKYKSVVP